MNIRQIDNLYCNSNKLIIRDVESSVSDLRKSLTSLGIELGKEICADFEVIQSTITTPLNRKVTDYKISNRVSVVISTKDDYEYLNYGLFQSIPGHVERGYMNFNGIRGTEALTAEIRDIKLPYVKHKVDYLIISKTVLATSCTAISLARKAYEEYKPKNLIFTSIFYSEYGVKELQDEFPFAKIILIGKPDALEKETGMLLPGLGNIDERTKNVA